MSGAQVFLDGRVTLHVGDCLPMLAGMDADSVDCVVTSPPYWGLRDYGVDGQIGLEPTLAEHLAVMVEVFEQVRRVLKTTGTCWVNYGDCYATSPNGRSAADTKASGNDDRTFRDKPFSTIQGTLKAKDLCMVPNRFAIAMQDAGWYVRSEIVWGKSNPMPESIKDRPATSHEKIFLFTKSARYHYDAEAVRQNRVQDEDANGFRGGSYVGGVPGPRQTVGNRRIDTSTLSGGAYGRHHLGEVIPSGERHEKARASKIASPRHADHICHTKLDGTPRGLGRNLRNYEPAPISVWPIATRAFPEAHFATFPPELAERCILAGCPKGGVVLDPFGGAGTTALVALRHQRRAALIELNADYAAMARSRIEKEWRAAPVADASPDIGPLFDGVPA
jgi:DNA modification methylase